MILGKKSQRQKQLVCIKGGHLDHLLLDIWIGMDYYLNFKRTKLFLTLFVGKNEMVIWPEQVRVNE